MNRFLYEQTLPIFFLQKHTLINWGILGSFILVFMLSSTSSFATCYGNVNDGGEIGSDQTICTSANVTLTNEDLPSGGYGDLEYLWLSNTSGPNVSGADSYFSTSPTYNTGNLTETTWFRRCSRRNGCSSWNYGESNWVKITIGNAEFEHVDGVNETACDANDGKIITDPFINQGTVLPYSVEYTYNGQVFPAGSYATNEDHYITGLAPGVYSNITIIDANNCTSVWGSDITIAEFNTGCTPPTVVNTCQLTDYDSRLLWLDYDNSGVKEYAVDNAFIVTEYSDGTALITGTATQVNNSNNTWQVNVKLLAKRNWAEWSALGRSYKPNNTIGFEDHTTWSYYELDNNNSAFTGLGDLAGKTLNITHNPSDYEFGFQIGLGANLKDGDEGFSGWFAFTGDYTGHGDFNGDFDCGTVDCSSISENIPGYIFLGEFNGSKYFCSSTNDKTWTEANALAQSIGGRLAVINDQEENDFLQTNMLQRSWIGYTDIDNEGTFTWTFGSSSFTNWNAGEPNNYNNNEDYTEILKSSGKWNDLSDSHTREFIVEIECESFLPARVGDWVFNDANGNGIQEAGEFGLPGISVILINTDDNSSETTTTNQNGNYDFTDLVAGNYKVIFPESGSSNSLTYNLTRANQGTDQYKDSDPTPMNDGSGNAMTDIFVVNAGDHVDTIDAGYYIGSTIAGIAFIETDVDGLQNGTEIRLDGVTVMLLDENGNMISSTTTASSGSYVFTNLAPGNYKVKFPEDATDGSTNYSLTRSEIGSNDDIDSDAVPMNDGSGNAMTQIVYVQNGATVDNLDAGYYPLSSIGDWVFNDANGNGIQEVGEFGLPGISVILINTDDNSSETTTTNQNGNYKFTDLVVGNYKVIFQESGSSNSLTYNLTRANQGTDQYKDSDPVALNNGSVDAMTDIFAVGAGNVIDTIDAGYYIGSTIAGIAFIETDVDGLQNGAETRLDGVTVMLLDENGNTISSTTTASDGSYVFTDLAPGNYKVKFPEDVTDGSTGYTLTQSEIGSDDDSDSDAVPSNDGSGNAITQIVYVQNGATIDNLDAGYYPFARIGDWVFNDANGNGIQEAGESGIPGISVILINTDDNSSETTTTNPNGNYKFTEVTVGNYQVKFPETVSSNSLTYNLTLANQGTDQYKDSGSNSIE